VSIDPTTTGAHDAADEDVVIVPVSDDALELFDQDTEDPFAARLPVATGAPVGDDLTDEVTIAEYDSHEHTVEVTSERLGTPAVVSPGGTGTAHIGASGLGHEVVVECPGCGTVCEGADPRPTAAWFCPNCDYPLFLAAPAPPAVAANSGLARRRLPGTDGREVIASEPCWACGERNPMGSMSCIRCNSQLVRPTPPAPLEVEAPEVEVEAVPVILVARRWPLILGGALGGALLTVLVTLLVV
jgi:hypothetical protein